MPAQDLEARVQILEDIEAIKKLHAKYCYLVDTGGWQEVVKLFVKDATIDFGTVGSGKNMAEITKFYKETFPRLLPFSLHMNHNPAIEVKGEKATGEWCLHVAATHGETNRALWTAGRYQNEYVKESGEWKIKTLSVKRIFATPYDEGWVKTRL